MNDPIHHAENALDTAYDIRNRDHYSGDRAADAMYHVQRAQVCATIAQAQESKQIAAQLKRIADALEVEGGRSELAESVAIFGSGMAQ